MIIITHDNGFAVSNEATMGVDEGRMPDKKTAYRKVFIKVDHHFDYKGELKVNDKIQCVILVKENRISYNGFVDSRTEKGFKIFVKDTNVDMDNFRKFVKQNIK
jgi:hypothetical protein